MNSSNYISEKSENLESIIDELNETIYNGELTEIIEVTYAYEKMPDGTYWNTTLFSEFGEIPLSDTLSQEKNEIYHLIKNGKIGKIRKIKIILLKILQKNDLLDLIKINI